MKIDLTKLFNAQKELDHYIQSQHNVTYSKILNELKLALIIELAEFANEIRCFKFWSVKGPSAEDVILEEYVDGIHFITSLCIYAKVDPVFEIGKRPTICKNKKILTKKFLTMFSEASNIVDAKTAKEWYIKYLKFGLSVGFSVNKILKAYEIKNKINHNRQKENY